MSSTEEQHMHDSSDGGDGAGSVGDFQNAATGQLDRSPGNIDKIREILFGTNMRDYDVRFARLEAALLKESGDLRESTRRRFETLENYLKKELESLHARLRTEREERAEALGQSGRDLKGTADAISRKIRDLEDQGAAAESAIHQDILNQSHILTEDIRALQAEITSLLEKRFQELNRGKTDRAMLGTLLTEIGMRINDEFHMPVAEK
jgi:DNA anti-recombination protein RmuC